MLFNNNQCNCKTNDENGQQQTISKEPRRWLQKSLEFWTFDYLNKENRNQFILFCVEFCFFAFCVCVLYFCCGSYSTHLVIVIRQKSSDDWKPKTCMQLTQLNWQRKSRTHNWTWMLARCMHLYLMLVALYCWYYWELRYWTARFDVMDTNYKANDTGPHCYSSQS